MHPIDFKQKWHLTYPELALVLGYESDYTVCAWGQTGKSKRNPPNVVFVACCLLDEKWQREGRKTIKSYVLVQAS